MRDFYTGKFFIYFLHTTGNLNFMTFLIWGYLFFLPKNFHVRHYMFYILMFLRFLKIYYIPYIYVFVYIETLLVFDIQITNYHCCAKEN